MNNALFYTNLKRPILSISLSLIHSLLFHLPSLSPFYFSSSNSHLLWVIFPFSTFHSISICEGRWMDQWNRNLCFLFCLLLISLPQILSLQSILFLSHFGVSSCVFSFCRETDLFYTLGSESTQLGQDFSGRESLLFPVALFVFFTSLLAVHKSAKLLINETVRCHIFPL